MWLERPDGTFVRARCPFREVMQAEMAGGGGGGARPLELRVRVLDARGAPAATPETVAAALVYRANDPNSAWAAAAAAARSLG